MHRAHHLEYVPRATVDRWFNYHLAAYVLILKAKVERDGFPNQYAVKREQPMTPQFKGLGAELSGLKRAIGEYTISVRKELVDIVTELPAAMAEARSHVTSTKQALQEVKDFNAEMKAAMSNGDPTSGSGSSSEPQKDGEQKAEPHASWTGEKSQG